MTSARIIVGLALQAAIVAEFIGSTAGLGYRTTVGQSQFDTSIVWAAIIVVMILAVIIDRGLYVLQRRLSRRMPA
jgi:ABC-type nitrate/sulfonate/bicarbonate transport system permease component